MTLFEAQEEARKRLSDKRFRHTANVASAARTLAERWGADPDKAELAGWLHDIVKEAGKDELLQLMNQDDIMAGSTGRRPYPIWHGPCGSIYAKHHLGVRDNEVLGAIACHTTGKKNMSLMDKILFLADATSAERSFPGVAEIRTLAKTDLDAAVIAAMEENIAYLERKGKPLDEHTQMALRQLRQQKEERAAKKQKAQKA